MSDDKRDKKNLPQGSWIGIGIAMGVALGAALDNIAIGIALGVAIGAALEGSSSVGRPAQPSPAALRAGWIVAVLAAIALILLAGLLFFRQAK